MNGAQACKILDIDPQNINETIVKKQYRALALLYHPDKSKDDNSKENIRDGANKKRAKSVTDQINNKKEYRRCHCPDTHAYNTLPHGVLRR